MSENDPEQFDRRRILKATGAALGAVAIGAGNASADHYMRGECVKLTYDYYPYTDCTRDEYAEEKYEKGTRGAVYDECKSEWGPMIHFLPEDNSLPLN
jgi:hypothetical protein